VPGGIWNFERGKKQQKIGKTINLRGGSIGGIVLPHPEVQGGIQRSVRGKNQQKIEKTINL